MRRTSVGSGQAISASALQRLTGSGKVALDHEANASSVSHIWVPIFDSVSLGCCCCCTPPRV